MRIGFLVLRQKRKKGAAGFARKSAKRAQKPGSHVRKSFFAKIAFFGSHVSNSRSKRSLKSYKRPIRIICGSSRPGGPAKKWQKIAISRNLPSRPPLILPTLVVAQGWHFWAFLAIFGPFGGEDPPPLTEKRSIGYRRCM